MVNVACLNVLRDVKDNMMWCVKFVDREVVDNAFCVVFVWQLQSEQLCATTPLC